MRRFRHWTPRYIRDRIAVWCYEKRNSDYPWLTCDANKILDSYLTKNDVGLEFGSGRSTLWFAKRICKLTSVEHNEEWASKIRKRLNEEIIENVDYRFVPKKEGLEGFDAPYVRIVDDFEDNSLDFCLVDGIYREFCALEVVRKIRPGGLLVIDNANWYLPSDSRSPNSRTYSEGPKGNVWKRVEQTLAGWRKIWTTSGVTDTAIFFKPCSL